MTGSGDDGAAGGGGGQPPRDGPGEGPVVLLVEDDPDVAAATSAALRLLAGARVAVVADGDAAARRVAAGGDEPDVVVTDIDLGGGPDGLQLAARLRGLQPLLPVVVLSGHATFDHAVVALRAGAAEFLAKPVEPDRLVAVVTALTARHRRLRAERAVSVLALGAHPDDVELGVGATLAKHVRRGHAVTALVLSGGEVGGEAGVRAREARDAAAELGVRLEHRALPDTAIGEGMPTVRLIEEVVRDTRPQVVYLHSGEDTHQDHRAVHRAGLVAARGVPAVLAYQSPSATVAFRPARFSDVTGFVQVKLAALVRHRSQARAAYLDPELVTATARYWGRFAGVRHAEPLEVVRDAASTGASADPDRVLPAPGVAEVVGG